MAKYKIIPSSRTIVQSPISIGHKAEKGVEAIEFDLTAWVETYGSGTLTVIMRRWGDAIPYPIALEIDENNKATWVLSDTDTARAGMAYAQLNYIVGDEVVKKSDIYTFRVMDSLTGEGDPPEAYESWLEQLTHLAAEAMAEVLDIEGIVTDKTLTVDGGIADAKAAGEALAGKVDAADYSALSARVGRNTIALAEKADRSTTYTKAQVDKMIEDVEVETDTTLEVAGAAADAAETGRQIGLLKADLGDVTNHAVKSAEQLISDKRTVDKVPYKYRASQSGKSDRAYDMIVGGTVGFNQLCNGSSVSTVSGRKYLTKIGGTWSIVSGTGSAITGLTSGTDMVIDLTSMFGTAIADHIYSLGQSQAGAGVALFRAMIPNDYYPYNAGSLISVDGLSAKEVVGFNLWDEEFESGYLGINGTQLVYVADASRIRSKNWIPVFPNTTYYYKSGDAGALMVGSEDTTCTKCHSLFTVDTISGGRTFTTLSKTKYVKFVPRGSYGTTYKHDICINVSDPLKNGQYEPYNKTVYPLDSSLTLRGVPILKDGKIEFDGDLYEADGTVTRKYAERAYQSGDESLANAITDGTNTVYKLSTATTETATPYTNPQVVNGYGTEEYVSTSICPVGHITEYPDNLRAKIDGLPWDLSMIAPVEVTYTATRNYTTGQLLIVDNTLYKVTANIANNGTITPNSNVVATTLSEVISALA